MGIRKNSFNRFLNHTRGTGATRISPTTGFIVGVDFSTTSNTIGTGSKTFTLTADANVNREWTVGENVLVTSQAGATGTMTGTVTSYTPSTQVLVINVPAGGTTGSGTSTDWRIGSLEVRRDVNGLVVEGLQGSNLALDSENFTTANWLRSNVTIQTGFTFAGIKFSKLIPNSIINQPIGLRYNQGLVLTSYSVFVKKAEHRYFLIKLGRLADFNRVSVFDFDSGRMIIERQYYDGNSTIEVKQLQSDIYQIIISVTANGLGGGQQPSFSSSNNLSPFAQINGSQDEDGLGGVYISGYQRENPSVFLIRSYIPTTTVSWTRNADTVTFNSTALQSVRQGQGVIYVDADFPSSSTRAAALSLTGTNSEISLARQSSGTTASFTKMVESGNTQVFGSSTGGNLFKNLGKQYEPALGTRNDTGATNTNLAIGLASNAVAFSGNGFGVAAGTNELTLDANLSSVTVRGLGGDQLNGSHWTGSRFVIASQSGRPLISIDGTSYRTIVAPVITQPCNEVTSGLVGAVTRIVMVGSGGGIYTSDDQGETWTARTSGVPNNITGVTFGNGRFVAAIRNTSAANQSIITSTDGITWTGALTGQATPNTNFNDVSFGNNLFVAVADNGVVWTSTNGTTWVSNTNTNTTAQLLGVVYAANLNIWVAVGVSGTIITATDPAGTWTVQTSGTTNGLNEVGIFNNEIYAVGTVSNVLRSTNGTTWSTVFALSGSNFNGIAASPSIMLLSGNSGWLYSSTDGTTFTSRTNNNQTLNGIAFGNNRFVSVGNVANGSRYVATIDQDGTVTRQVIASTNNAPGVDFVNGAFYTGDLNIDGQYYVSTDGITWVSRNTGFGGQRIVTFVGAGTRIYSIGSSSGNSAVRVAFSDDNGTTWTQTPGGNASTITTGSSTLAAGFSNSVLVIVANNKIFTSLNGTTYIERVSGTTQNLTSVMYSTRDNCWYAAGAGGTLLRSDDNAVTWYSINEAMQGYVLNNNTLQANATSRGNRDGRNRFALSFNTNSVKVAANGNMVLTDTSASIGSITAVTLGENFNGTIRNIRFFPTAKTDSELIQISLGATTPGINDTFAVNATGDTLQVNAAGDTLRIN